MLSSIAGRARRAVALALTALTLAIPVACTAPAVATAAPTTVSAADLSGLAGAIAANRRRLPAVTYDTSIGNGVDANGFANLPLRPVGTDGADVTAAAPTLDTSNCTYTAGTRTINCTFTGPIARWPNVLTPGQQYHIQANVVQTSATLIIQDENGNTQWTDPSPYYAGTRRVYIDAVFTATGHDLIWQRVDDGFAGSIQMVKVAPNSGGPGGHRFYVNPLAGDDTRNGTLAQNPATPLATLAQAMRYVQSGRGDQVVFAQGQNPSEPQPSIITAAGYSPTYPFVLQTYDPADPTNEAKMGRATGSARPKFTSGPALYHGSSDPAVCCQAIRGFEYNPGNVADATFTINHGSGGTTPSYILLENDVFAYTSLSVDATGIATPLTHLVVRNSAFYGQWSATSYAQGFYFDGVDGVTVEDSAFWHSGWKVGAARSDAPSAGGPQMFAHAIYGQQSTINTVVRRSIFIDNSSDAGELKGGGLYQNNISLNNPIGPFVGFHQNEYSTLAPFGVYIDTAFNAVLGSDGNQNWGIESVNGKPFSRARYNLVAQVNTSNSFWGYAFMADAGADAFDVTLPSFITYDHNVSYNWGNHPGYGSAATCLSTDSGKCSFVHATFANNLWDDASGGTNTNNASHSFAKAFTPTGLVNSLGYADLATAEADFIAHPDKHPWRAGSTLALTGYGIAPPGLTDLATDMRVTAGLANAGQFVGTRDGSALTSPDMPACMSLDGGARAWRATSACAPQSTTVHITETLAGLSHTTAIPLNVYARPTLSSISVTPTLTGASLTFTPSVGSGNAFYSVGPNSFTGPWQFVRASHHGAGADYIAGTVAGGSQAVTSTAPQSVSVSGLSSNSAYYFTIAQVDDNNNPTVTSSIPFTTTGTPPTQWSSATSSPHAVISGTGNTTVTFDSSVSWTVAVANNAKSTGSFTITIPTYAGFLDIGLANGTVANSGFALNGQAAAVVLRVYNGDIYLAGTKVGTYGSGWNDGDVIKVQIASGGMVTFYHNGVALTSAIDASAIGTSLFPVVGSGNSGQVINADFTNW